MQKHDDIDTPIRDLTELLYMINYKSHDKYITSMKQCIINPLAWLHTEKIKRAAETAEGANLQPPTAPAQH
jgi:hypothetical protein